MKSFDVDIDIKPTIDRTKYGTRAMVYNETTQKISPHAAGIYLHDVPVDPVTNLCAFDYKHGNQQGHPKVDLLNNTAYELFESKQDIIDTMEVSVDWDLFLDEEIVSKLPHIGNHFDLVRRISPMSVLDLADVLALIRPGKSHLVSDYIKNKDKTRKVLYRRSTEAYFKKSHAISYAMMIVLVLVKNTNRAGVVW